MKVRLAAVLGVAAVVLATVATPAAAMGSGNPFVDMQTGVTYTVYQPTFTAGLKVRHVGPNLAGYPGVEQNLVAMYGRSNGRNVSVTEGNPMASDIGAGLLVKTVIIQGQTAKVYAYCDPAKPKKCSMADISRVGGNVQVTLPAAPGLRPTIVWVETIGSTPISGQQLISIARGLRPVQ